MEGGNLPGNGQPGTGAPDLCARFVVQPGTAVPHGENGPAAGFCQPQTCPAAAAGGLQGVGNETQQHPLDELTVPGGEERTPLVVKTEGHARCLRQAGHFRTQLPAQPGQIQRSGG